MEWSRVFERVICSRTGPLTLLEDFSASKLFLDAASNSDPSYSRTLLNPSGIDTSMLVGVVMMGGGTESSLRYFTEQICSR